MGNLRRVSELWRRRCGPVWYLPVALALFVGSLLPALHSHGTQFGGMPNRPYDVLAVAGVVLQCVPLVVCRRWPVTCSALVSLGFAIDQFGGYHSFAGTALPIALLTVGLRLERHRRLAAIVFSAAYVGAAVAFTLLGGTESLTGYVTFYLALVLAWGFGTWLRSDRGAEAERRLRVAEETRAAERARIAAELHDVVTHHVTAMVVQAEAARYLTDARLERSLTAVADTGRLAIADLRHLLDVIGTGHGAEAIPTLVERTRLAGQPVEYTEKGEPEAPAGDAGPVAYRVVQEALTNALKHARGSRTSVRVHHGDGEITVAVDTDESGAHAGSPDGGGRGLAGLRERIDGLDGDFSAGRRRDGGFSVRARIPARTPS
ncbi:two-component sensor histidine kinase [Amycolatopsis sp. WAC 01375]|uniref:sensor histidine kinase n=1 Tax=Amycolatopsis sp. WAC 01375 TaxID=2203194 RepID=UPI000F79368E|nr:histidine kinase [Amycolatopsis sp. WAC 01375]RSM82700.1 two-component sensor histidine kinase [Amycolatopsis sp. WAC 01375]